jgi:hypothetical protein
MRICPNTACVAFGRIVYSVATRCPICKWDLKPHIIVEASSGAFQKPDKHTPAPRK